MPARSSKAGGEANRVPIHIEGAQPPALTCSTQSCLEPAPRDAHVEDAPKRHQSFAAKVSLALTYGVLYSPCMRDPATPQLSLWAESPPPTPAVHATESPYWHGSLASRAHSHDAQKQVGQFMTPAPIARFMAA